jgi:4-hydroxy-tetrahydrodipicolinate reductase
MTGGGTLRVVQWATGNIGRRSLRQVIEHPDLELVGLYVYAEAKAGRDAGELCGVAPVGVTATQDVDEIVGLGADCVLYMGDRVDVDVLCRLLASGANVVTTRGEFHRPASMDSDVRARIEAACDEGATSIHSTGSSPGFITEALPLVLLSLQRRFEGLVIDEFADVSSRNSPELLFDVMGFGKDPAVFDQRRWAHGAASFGPSLSAVGDAIGLPIDSVDSTGEVAVARHDVAIAAGTVPAGTVAAQRMVVTGRRGGEPLLTFRANWYCATEVEPAWDLRGTGWRVVVDGDTPLDVSIGFPVEPERYADTTPNFTANRPVNAIRYVVAAEPGIRTTAELPQVIPTLGVR